MWPRNTLLKLYPASNASFIEITSTTSKANLRPVADSVSKATPKFNFVFGVYL